MSVLYYLWSIKLSNFPPDFYFLPGFRTKLIHRYNQRTTERIRSGIFACEFFLVEMNLFHTFLLTARRTRESVKKRPYHMQGWCEARRMCSSTSQDNMVMCPSSLMWKKKKMGTLFIMVTKPILSSFFFLKIFNVVLCCDYKSILMT